MATVNVRVRELMIEKSKRDGRWPNRAITQEEIAKAINVPQGTLSRWVGNKVDRLDKEIMTKLCEYFECEIGDLLELVKE